MYSSCQFQCMRCMRQGSRWILPHKGCDLGLLPGVEEGIGSPQGDVEVLDLGKVGWIDPRLLSKVLDRNARQAPGWEELQHSLLHLFMEQGACLFVVPDGVFDGKDGHRLIAGLHT